MIKPISIEFKDLLSHKDSSYTFLDNKTVIVSGHNLDDKGVESNGSGKSTIIEALSIALTGDPFRKIKNSELARNDTDFAEVIFTFLDLVRNTTIKIIRRIPSKGSTKVEIWENGVLNESLKDLNPKETNQYILELLDLSKDDLLNYFIVSKETYKSFFCSTDGQKKEIINRFSKAYMIEDVEENVKLDINKVLSEIDTIEKNKLQIESKLEIYNQQLEEVKNEGVGTNSLIFDLEEQLELAKENESKLLVEITELEKIKEAKEKAVEELPKVDYQNEIKEIQKEVTEYRELSQAQNEEIKSNKELLSNMENVIRASITCPKCSHEFCVDHEDISIEEAKEMIPVIKEEITKGEENLYYVEFLIDSTKDKVSALQREEFESTQKRSKAKREIIEAAENLKMKQFQHKKESEKRKLIEGEIDEFQNRVKEDKTAPILKNIKLLNEKLDVTLANVSDKQLELSKLQYCSANFKKFRSYLANQSIKAIEAYTNHFLELMNTNLSVRIDGFRLKADGKIKEEIEVAISRDGLGGENFYKFSSGEKTKVDIAGILALQSIINNNSNNGIDLLCLDEIIESVDGTAAREIIKALNSLNQNIMIITHTAYNSGVDNVLRVEKKNGISKILN